MIKVRIWPKSKRDDERSKQSSLLLIKRAEHAHLRDVLLSLQWKREETDKINESESQKMNRDDFKEFSEIIKIDEVSQKL